MRSSPDHLVERAQALVKAGDHEGLLGLVRSLTTYPAGRRSSSDLLHGRRWGHRATLRGGAGTPREKADLLAALYRQAGWEAKVVAIDHEIDQAALFTRHPKALFDPGITPDRLAILRSALGLPEKMATPEPLDPGGRLSAALADGVMATFDGELAVFDPFEWSNNRQLPAVVVTLPQGEYLADPWSGGAPTRLSEVGPVELDSHSIEPIELVLGIVRSAEPSQTVTVATWVLDPSELPGRYVTAKFLPAVNSIDELMAVRPRDVTTFIPGLVVRGVDLTLEESQVLSFRGTPFTIGGSTIDIDGTGPIRLGESDLGDGGLDRVSEVRGISLTDIQPGGFTQIRVEADVVDAGGATIEGLPASAFGLSEDGNSTGFVLVRNRRPDPRILFLLDGSSSIPADFLGEGAADVVRAIAEGVATTDPAAQFRVAMASFEDADPVGEWTSNLDELRQQGLTGIGYGSALWEALMSASSLDASTIVFITDADPTVDDAAPRTEVPLDMAASVALGPPTVMVGVGPVNQLHFDAFVAAGRVPGTTAGNPPEAIASVLSALNQSPPAPYVFTYQAPFDGAETRELSITGNGVAGDGSYLVPPIELRVVPPSIIGLSLTIRHRGQEVNRILAGVAPGPDVVPTTALVAEIRSGLFGEYVLEFEGAAPAPSVLYDEALSVLLGNRSVADAITRDELLSAFREGTFMSVPTHARTLSIPLPSSDGGPLTYETNLRMTLHHRRELPSAGSTGRIVTGFDILPFTSFTTADDDATEAFKTTARRTARLALMESAVSANNTVAWLRGQSLTAVGFSVFDLFEDRSVAGALAGALESWDAFGVHAAVPENGTPVAAWAIERSSGTMWGVLGSGAGGGTEEADINQTFDDARSTLESIRFAGDISTMLGMPGLSFGAGVWIQLELTKLEKLRAATIMLATMTAPEGDISDLGDLACDLARSAAGEGIGRATGGILGEEAGEIVGRIDAGVSVGETLSGGGFC